MLHLDQSADAGVEDDTRIVAGDLVRTGNNRFPYFRVIAIQEERAWIRDVQIGEDYIVPVSSCLKISRPAQ